MTAEIKTNAINAPYVETAASHQNWLYKTGGAAALIALLFYVLDISISFGGEGTAPGIRTAVDWFTHIQSNGLLELRNLGFLNVISTICGIPLYFALYTAHRQANKTFAAFAALVFFISAAIYLSNNPAIPMLVLSGKYAAATTDAQRTVLAAAGEAMLAQGEDFTPGFFTGFIFAEIAGLLIALVMLRGGVFSKVNAYTGIVGFALLTIFTVWSTFAPERFDVAMIVAMVGGISGMAWYVQTARRLFQLR